MCGWRRGGKGVQFFGDYALTSKHLPVVVIIVLPAISGHSSHMPRFLPPFSTARVHVLDEDMNVSDRSTQAFGLMVFSSFISFVELIGDFLMNACELLASLDD